MTHCSMKEARESSGETAEKIATGVGLSRSQLYRVESGECQAALETCRKMRDKWPQNKVPDIAIYDPVIFEQRRASNGKRTN